MAEATGLVAPSGGRLLALLLVVVLLLCHGAFGVLHLSHTSCDPCDPPAAGTSGAHHHAAPQHDDAAGDDGGSSGFWAHGLGGSGYFAVVLALLGAAAVLGTPLLGVARGSAVVAFSRSYRPLHSPLADLLPRGPTLPLLQVFRL